MLKDFLTDRCCVLDYVSVPNPNAPGGMKYEWREGAAFVTRLVMNNSSTMQVAYGQGQETSYTLVVEKPIEFTSGQRIKRLSDGLILQLTSNTRDMKTPELASDGMQYSVANAKAVQV